MQITHNMMAMNSNRVLGIVGTRTGKISEILASGYRINRSADDASGLAISEKMRRQIRGLSQASVNAQDGISLVQSAEGAMNEMHEIVQRGNELAVKAANGTLTDEDRKLADSEIQQLKKALDEAANNTVFNEVKLFPETGLSPKTANIAGVNHYNIKFNLTDRNFLVESAANPAAVTSTTAPAAVTNAVDVSEGAGQAGGVTDTGSVLADKIANELITNAISQILDAFPSLKAAVGSDSIEMALDISYLDGPSNTLAYAQCAFYGTGEPFSFLIKVDSADFSDADAEGTGARAEMLESTIAHELMHSVMQYTMTDEMTGRNNAVEMFPSWFKEGTAQLTGGGYTTGWNDALDYYADSLSDADDTSMDATIADYLDNYTVSGRPYGHGYLASAYLGYKAYVNDGGTGDISADTIAAGMDKIFSDILGGKSFDAALSDNTGMTSAGVESLFANGDADLVSFVRKLSYASNNGAGSVIASSLGDGGTTILGDSAAVQQFYVNPDKVNVDMSNGDNTLFLQVGAEPGTHIEVRLFQMSAKALGLENTNVRTADAAGAAIGEFKSALQSISRVRSYYGAIQNRLEHTINNLENVIENTTAAESAIRDTDMAKAMVEYTSLNILQQAGQAILVQSNHYPEFILGLLQG